MRDWSRLVEERLGGMALEPEERAEIIAEVAAHLEDSCEEMRKQGIAEEEAVQQALSRVGNWRHLENRVFAVKRREHFMRNRVRQLWLPGLLALLLSILLLMSIQRIGFPPYVTGSGAGSVLLYWPWLLSLPVFGALAAYVSFRAGASRARALLASVFPSAALATAFLLMFPIGLAAELVARRHSDFPAVAEALLRDALGWLVIPGMALLAGGLCAQPLIGRGAPRSPIVD
jgi:hypothetical protein